MQAIIDAFEKTHPSKEVVHTQFVNTNDGNLKLDIALEGGNHIDVFFTYSVKSLAQRSSSGIMPDLSKRLRADKRLVGYLDAAVPKSFRVAGKVGALAASRSPLITIVNDALRDNASFDLPQEWDLAELRQISKKMSKFVAVSGGLAISDIARIAPGPNHQYTKSGNSNFSDPPFENWLPTGHEMIRTGESYPWTEVLSRHLPVYQKIASCRRTSASGPLSPSCCVISMTASASLTTSPSRLPYSPACSQVGSGKSILAVTSWP